MSKVVKNDAKNNAKCEIFATYAEIISTDSIDKQSIELASQHVQQ